MDRYISQEACGNLHEALMHVNKAVCKFIVALLDRRASQTDLIMHVTSKSQCH
jgi:hypothetical protein